MHWEVAERRQDYTILHELGYSYVYFYDDTAVSISESTFPLVYPYFYKSQL